MSLGISVLSASPSEESSSTEDFRGLFRGSSSSSETSSAISSVSGKDSEVVDDTGVLGGRRGKRKFRAASWVFGVDCCSEGNGSLKRNGEAILKHGPIALG